LFSQQGFLKFTNIRKDFTRDERKGRSGSWAESIVAVILIIAIIAERFSHCRWLLHEKSFIRAILLEGYDEAWRRE
jgi:hypothetical protein